MITLSRPVKFAILVTVVLILVPVALVLAARGSSLTKNLTGQVMRAFPSFGRTTFDIKSLSNKSLQRFELINAIQDKAASASISALVLGNYVTVDYIDTPLVKLALGVKPIETSSSSAQNVARGVSVAFVVGNIINIGDNSITLRSAGGQNYNVDCSQLGRKRATGVPRPSTIAANEELRDVPSLSLLRTGEEVYVFYFQNNGETLLAFQVFTKGVRSD
jgi:hypothetical protein